jgi:hypothetical protein
LGNANLFHQPERNKRDASKSWRQVGLVLCVGFVVIGRCAACFYIYGCWSRCFERE